MQPRGIVSGKRLKKLKSPNARAHFNTGTSFVPVSRNGGVGKKGGLGGRRGEGEHLGNPRSGDKRRIDKSKSALRKALRVVVNKPVDARGLTGRDAAFVTNLLKGMPKIEAMKFASKAIGVEVSDSAASVAASKSLQKAEVESAIVSALNAAGVTDEIVAEKLKDGLNAMAFTQGGFEHDDYRTRLGYIQTILKVKGQMGADVANTNQILNYTSFKEDSDE